MRESCVELSVGDSVRLDDHVLTVIDIHGDDVTFRVDRLEDPESPLPSPLGDSMLCRQPR